MFNSSIGKKYWMALTGAFLMFFVVTHLLGNLQIFLGPDWMNSYAQHLADLPALLWPMRILLVLALTVHMITGIWLGIDNRRARPVRYAGKGTVQATVASRTMIPLGLAIFCFILFHLMHYTWGTVDPSIAHLTDAKGRHDVYSMVILGFQDPAILWVYLAAMFFLAAHLRHGGYSFLQSLGLLRQDNVAKAKRIALAVAVLIFLGYSSIAVSSYQGWIKPIQRAVSAVERGASHGA